jgi:hypothetical protein
MCGNLCALHLNLGLSTEIMGRKATTRLIGIMQHKCQGKARTGKEMHHL